MKNKDKIRYLSQYKALEKEIIENENRYAALRARLTSPSLPVLSDMPKGSGRVIHDSMAENICELDELEEIVREQNSGLIEMQKEIHKAINSLKDSSHRRIMTKRYIDGLSWEEVCVSVNYSWKHTHRLHSQALSMVELKHDTK